MIALLSLCAHVEQIVYELRIEASPINVASLSLVSLLVNVVRGLVEGHAVYVIVVYNDPEADVGIRRVS